MKKYTLTFDGTIMLTAESENRALEIADELLGFDWWTYHNCDEISIDNIDCVNEEDIEE